MTRSGYVLLSIAVILGAAYVYFFTDMFTKQAIQIIPQIRPGRPANASRSGNAPSVYPVSFLFDGKYKLTSLKVVAAEELKTNKYAHPAWHLISESNSLPTKNVIYGSAPKGMKSAIDRMRPEPLQPDIPYTLFVEAGKIKGQTNFFTKEMVSAP
jgi:hypothetical protein